MTMAQHLPHEPVSLEFRAARLDQRLNSPRGQSDSTISLQPIQIMTGCEDRQGMLVLANAELVAVLVRLDSDIHEGACGGWFVEAGFGPCQEALPEPTFDSLELAQVWIKTRVEAFLACEGRLTVEQ